ncbi:phosphatidylinositol transfer protein 2 [Tieghemostelium lacteum]|uniref:Phosphatidylinositol transfer protein 2 n=1 Tax=Tieghemostelium lacteum TaxID=361077 RepID=A0A151ZFA2_TIELA|nr:phosphatidylinositol transfer protein 2 [Tieghemostelium lacteum]|eukprot:KYQ92651.1 phosphatidylinositol transfer protein 2 [Tieghemostelium lacteum]
MIIKEYRIILPLTVEEYQIAQLYMVAKKSKENTKDGEGIEILTNEPYEDAKSKGQYTHKVIYLAKDSLPRFASMILPASALQVHEKAWNAFPYCKTEYSCPFFGDKLVLSLESMHKEGKGEIENALSCDADTLKNRTVDFIDISNDPIDSKDYKESEDPSKFKSEKTGRGPLVGPNWKDTITPSMTCYKLCRVEFRYWGLQTKVENFIHKTGVRDVLLKAHKALFCWIDEWYGLTIDDIRKIEQDTKDQLKKALDEQKQQQQKSEK